MAETVFISGVAGFLGSHLADHFLARGHRVVGCDDLSGGYADNVPEGVEFHRVDCNDVAALKPITRGVDVVVHAAAAAYEGLSVFSPHAITQSVVSGSAGMFAAAIAGGARRVVFCSSMARYGAHGVTFTEDLVPRPQDPYGIAKLSAEVLLRNLCEVHGVEYVIAVPHNIIGPRQKYDDPYRNVAAIFVNLLLQGQPIRVYGDGSQRRCFSFVSDVVSPLRQMATDPRCVGEVINVGPDDEFVSVRDLASLVARLMGVELRCEFLPPRPQEVALANCSADKARSLLGYRPRVSLEDGLAAMIDWISARGPRPFVHHVGLEIVNAATPSTWSKP